MQAFWLITLFALAACSAQQQAVTVPPGTCVVDVQDEPFFSSYGLLSLANGQIAERNTQRGAYARAHARTSGGTGGVFRSTPSHIAS
jgi:hypothetical protein